MLPEVLWHVTLAEIVAAVALFVVGYTTHEAMHIGALEIFGEPYTVEFMPDGWRGALWGGTGIAVRMESVPPRWRVVAVLLAPIIAALPPLAGYAVALSYPVLDVGTALVLGAWFIGAIPGLHDWGLALSYHPEKSVPTEVIQE